MNTVTVAIMIGNSDNKLTQQKWSEFVDKTRNLTRASLQNPNLNPYFMGGSPYDSPYQNACFVVGCPKEYLQILRIKLSELANNYNQDAIALLAGTTEFVEPS